MDGKPRAFISTSVARSGGAARPRRKDRVPALRFRQGVRARRERRRRSFLSQRLGNHRSQPRRQSDARSAGLFRLTAAMVHPDGPIRRLGDLASKSIASTGATTPIATWRAQWPRIVSTSFAWATWNTASFTTLTTPASATLKSARVRIWRPPGSTKAPSRAGSLPSRWRLFPFHRDPSKRPAMVGDRRLGCLCARARRTAGDAVGSKRSRLRGDRGAAVRPRRRLAAARRRRRRIVRRHLLRATLAKARVSGSPAGPARRSRPAACS